MAKRRNLPDPHAEREASNYENPVPSREYILEQLKESEKGISQAQLRRQLEIEGEEQEEGLRRRIKAMLRDGQIIEGRRGQLRAISGGDSMVGKVIGHRDGFGFVSIEGEAEDVYLANRQMQQVFDGDTVKVEVTGIDQRGRREGVIVEVLEHNTQQLVGKLMMHRGLPQVVPENTRIQNWLALEDNDVASAKEGDYVMVELTQQPGQRQQARGRITEVLGDRRTVGVATELAIRSHDIPFEWSEAVEEEARRFGSEPKDSDKTHRVDLRQLPLVTIDGEDARDFDDAVYCEPKKSGGYRLWVAIADVSHYVQVGSALDQEAHKRATSVYFPDRVVPMLPEALSNGLCSLKPDVDRLTMVCEMTISASGKLSGYVFYEGLIRSHARLTYNEVGALLELEGVDPKHNTGRNAHLLPQLRYLQDLYKVLRKARSERGAIDFETVETRIVFDDEKRIEAIVPIRRHDAHKLIEECMLCANVATARALDRSGLEALYRVHSGPSEQKLTNLREFLGEIGLSLQGGEEPSPKDYQMLLSNLGDRPDAAVIQTMMLRSLSQAVYHPENEGHFGLHYAGYTHFTSPIRRYPDLLVHRALRYLVRSGGGEAAACFHKMDDAPALDRKAIYPYDFDALVAQGANSSMAERRADEASRDVMAFLKCEFLQDHVGSEHDGIIAAVTGFGMFVELQDLYIEGLVHITALPQDFYQFDQAHQRLVGERTRRVYQLGDTLRVQVLAVNLDQRKIDLGVVLVEGEAGRKAEFDSAKPASDAPPRKRRKPGQGRGRGGDTAPASAPRRRKPADAAAPAAKSAPRKKRQPAAPIVDVPVAVAPKKTSVREALAKGLKGLMPSKSKAAAKSTAKPKAGAKAGAAKLAESASGAEGKPRRSRSGAKAAVPKSDAPKKSGGKVKSGAPRTRRSR
ncbi:MAG: ribonuclease R [Zhongshania sp.]|uniref:ribonuclease R n=1 Tax=Zhongshania sp. TaxID=1971902 RepID=UPI0026173ACD|nr:ribonuclease R [Zhongshania sp.]MDF1693657.1 ribonuclease R [Zhongshania sp.]